MSTIVSIGEILWDVFPTEDKLGGAPFNFSVHARRLGHLVAFVSAVGDDARGRHALKAATALGLPTDFVAVVRDAGTGVVTVKVDDAGQPDFTIHRPAAYDGLRLEEEVLEHLAGLAPDWLYFGTLHQANAHSHAETAKLMAALPRTARFYDINLRRDSYTRELIAELMLAAEVVKLNEDEARVIDQMFGQSHATLAEFTADWSARMQWRAVAVTRGANGCSVRIGEDYVEAPGYAVRVADTVGSGDAFAAAFLHGLSSSWPAAHIADFANRVGAVVAARPGGVPHWTLDDCRSLEY